MSRRLMLPALAALGLLAACSEPRSKVEDSALSELQARLPGRYDNTLQVRADQRTQAAQPQAPLDLLIVPANAALIGKTVYYVRETAGGEAHRVLSQFIWVFGRTVELQRAPERKAESDAAAMGRLEQHIYILKEPQRWLRAAEQPEMLESLLPADLERLTGCELLWTRTATGFTAERRSKGSCNPESRYEGQLIEQQIDLQDTRLALLEQQITPDGLIDAPAGSADSWYRFVRRGAAN